jgi:hypothetical protein
VLVSLLALKQAKQEHETKVKKIEKDRASVAVASCRWEKQKEKLETALRKARD